MSSTILLVPEAAAELGVSRYTVWRYIDARLLPASRLGRDWVILRADLDAFRSQQPRRGRPRKSSAA